MRVCSACIRKQTVTTHFILLKVTVGVDLVHWYHCIYCYLTEYNHITRFQCILKCQFNWERDVVTHIWGAVYLCLGICTSSRSLTLLLPVCFFFKKGREADVIGDYWSLSKLHLLILHCVFILLQPFHHTAPALIWSHNISVSAHTYRYT